MLLLALDLSLTSSGFAFDRPGRGLELGTLTNSRTGCERLDWICRQVVTMAEQADVVALEGYAFARANQAHQIGELGGVVRLALWDRKVPVLEVAPSKLKRYATGKGNASKDAVLVEAVRRLGYEGSSKDEADAFWLYAMVRDLAGVPVAEVPKSHRSALDGVELPVRAADCVGEGA